MQRPALALLLLFTLTTLTGCCCPAINSAREAAQKAQSLNNIRQLCLAVMNYQQINEAWPETIDDLRSQVPDLDMILENPVTMDNPGYEYVKPEGEDPVLSETVIIYQLRNGQRDMTLPVGYADGSVH